LKGKRFQLAVKGKNNVAVSSKLLGGERRRTVQEGGWHLTRVDRLPRKGGIEIFKREMVKETPKKGNKKTLREETGEPVVESVSKVF